MAPSLPPLKANPPHPLEAPNLKSASVKAAPVRIGQAQAVSLFWGAISLSFTVAACYFFIEFQSTDKMARQQRDEILSLKEENQKLESEKSLLRALNSDTMDQQNTREQILKEKEQHLAQAESHLEDVEQLAADLKRRQKNEISALKKFAALARKLVSTPGGDLLLQDNRPLLRIDNNQLFSFGETKLKPEGRDLLLKLIQGLDPLDFLELHITVYADASPEVLDSKPEKDQAKTKDNASKSIGAWEVTSARAVAILHFFKENGTLPLDHIICLGRGDLNPISSPNTIVNRRTEIALLPQSPQLPVDAVPLPPLEPAAVSPKEGTHHAPSPTNAPVSPPPAPLAPPGDIHTPGKTSTPIKP